jgi:hypothetical protein
VIVLQHATHIETMKERCGSQARTQVPVDYIVNRIRFRPVHSGGEQAG